MFGDAVHLMADALGLELDEVRCEAEYAQTTEDLDLGSWTSPPAASPVSPASWQGIRRRPPVDRPATCSWRKGRTLEPDWKVEHGYLVDIQGMPTVRTKLEVFPPPDFVAKSFSDYMVLGMIMTAMPAVNAIPAICNAKPGIRTYADLPLITARGLMR